MSAFQLPLVFACSGCSNAGQLANRVAVALDRSGIVEMSCISGVGGDVMAMIQKAKSAQRIVAIDGCRTGCVVRTLARHGIDPQICFTLTDLGYRKLRKTNFKAGDVHRVIELILSRLADGD